MRVLLSTIGSRGDVQPLVALASQLRLLGQEVRVCVPPDFREWIEGLGIPVVPIGPEVRPTAPSASVARALPSDEQRRQLIEGTVAAQFATILPAARECDLVVGCGALQVAAPSVAEALGIGYVHVHYCPVTLPSTHHAPPPQGWPQDASADNHEQWATDAQRWNHNWGAALNTQRAALGLSTVRDVRSHIFTDRPWLAADPTLGPAPADVEVVQTGAWILPDARPLPADLEAFLSDGEPPVYVGLGSMAAPGEGLSPVLVQAARALGRRVIVSRGWADLPLADDGADSLLIDEVNHQALFPRVAAVVHHGGAGTTTAAARAGVAQVIIPQRYDQHYWAHRVDHLGIGTAHQPGMPTTDSLAAALSRALQPEIAARARDLAPAIQTDGAQIGAHGLMDVTSQGGK